MLRVEVVSFASPPARGIAALEQEYVERLRPWCAVDVRTEGEARKNKVLKEIVERGGRCVRILLDEKGDSLSSREFASLLSTKMNQGASSVVLLIGPTDGWKDEDRETADISLSLSRMTFTAHLCRLLALEQVYRAFSILRGTAYHRE